MLCRIKSSVADSGEYFFPGVPIEGEAARQAVIHNHTKRPSIALLRIFTFNNFRGNVIRCSCNLTHRLTLVPGLLTETEVDQLDLTVLGKHDIVGLYVLMSDVQLVAVDQSSQDLLDSLGCELL